MPSDPKRVRRARTRLPREGDQEGRRRPRERPAANERRIVQAALRADTREVAGEGGWREQRIMVDALTGRLDELDAELADLRHREQLRRTLDQAGSCGRRTLEQVTRLLGPRPEEENRRRLWDTARSAIEDYRETWQIGNDTPLGPAPTDIEQQHHRDRVTELVRTVAPRLTVPGPEFKEPGQSVERAL